MKIRVTLQDIEASIKHETYFTAHQGAAFSAYQGTDRPSTPAAQGGNHPQPSVSEARDELPEELRLLTICALTLTNGVIVLGQSACVSKENFNADLGKQIARENAINQMWMLLGFNLRQKLYEEGLRVDHDLIGDGPAEQNLNALLSELKTEEV